MLVAMSIGAALCIGIGCYPQMLYALLPYPVDFSPYDTTHVLAQTQLLAFSALAFTSLKLYRIYPPELRSTNLDADWVYRRLVPSTLNLLWAPLARINQWGRSLGLTMLLRGPHFMVRHHVSEGLFARSWPTGNMVLWVATLLGLTLVLYYL